jgi:uncharacterized coiled-coil protein SlyX
MCGCHTQPIVVTVDLTAVLARLDQLEATMATETEQLTALSAKIDDVISDVRAALAILTAERDNLGTEGQAALDALTAKVDAFDAEVGDADGSDVPVEP